MNTNNEKKNNNVLTFDNQTNVSEEESLKTPSQTSKRKILFFSNSPVDDIESYKEGVDAISEMVDEKDVFNIGIIAPYGAGKSSLIKTYRQSSDHAKKHNLVEISLLHLSDNKVLIEQNIEKQNSKQDESQQNQEEQTQNEELERTCACESDNLRNIDALLEKSILEQLFFREEKKTLPASRIERIHNKLPLAFVFSLLLVLSFVLSLFTVLQFNGMLPLLDDYVEWPEKTLSHNLNLVVLTVVSAALIIATVTIFSLFLKNAKINFQNIEIEFNKIKSGSPLNFFLDEIIYFFQRTATDIVIFEDIERFGSVSLFTKLREINHVLNHNKRIKRKITFIYCVTDDFFASEEDRAKFFEFVISLVPIMNTKNGGKYINECLWENGIKALDAVFLKGIAHFISDKRVLNDVINDFLYFRSNLTKKTRDDSDNAKASESIIDSKLFAMMVYKNLFFADYVNLLKDKGDLFNLFNSFKQDCLKALSKSKKDKFDELESEIKKVSELTFVSEKMGDLKNLVTGIICKYGNASVGAPNGFSDIESIKSFENLKTGLFVKLQVSIQQGYGYYPVGGSSFKSMTIDDLNNRLGRDVAYVERVITGQYLNKLTEEKQKIAKEISEINGKTLKQIIEMNEYDNEFLKKPFVTFAVSNGYIDETYYLYIGKRSPMINSDFVNNVLCNIPSEPSIRLNHCDLIIDELSSLDANAFQKKSVLNYSITDYLFNGKIIFAKQRETFINYLCSNKDNEIKNFIKGFFASDYPFDNFFISLCKKDKKIVSDLLSYSDVSEGDKVELIKILIKNKTAVDISSLNEDGAITRMVEKNDKPLENFACLFDSFDSCIDFFELIKLKKFEHIDYNGSDNPVWKEVFFYFVDNDCYAINYDNIQTIEFYYLEKNEINLSSLLGDINPVSNYVRSDLDGLIKIICEKNDILHEEQKVVKELLASKEIGDETKELFVSTLADSVKFDSAFSPEVITLLLKHKKLAKEWRSLSTIYDTVEGARQYIPSFVRENIDSFSDVLSDKKLCLFLVAKFGEKDIEIVEKLADQFDAKLDIDDFSSDYLCKLFIEKSIIEANEDNFLKCSNKIESLAAMLIKNRDLESHISVIKFDINSLIRALQNSSINDDCKNVILESNAEVVESNSSNEALLKYLLDLFKNTKRVCFNPVVAINIINRLNDSNDSLIREDLIDACLQKYADNDLVVFINAVDPSAILKFTSKRGESLLKVNKEYIESNKFAKALITKRLVRITRNGQVNKTVDVSKLATFIDK